MRNLTLLTFIIGASENGEYMLYLQYGRIWKNAASEAYMRRFLIFTVECPYVMLAYLK